MSVRKDSSEGPVTCLKDIMYVNSPTRAPTYASSPTHNQNPFAEPSQNQIPTPAPKQNQTYAETSTPTEILSPTPTQYQTHTRTSTETFNPTPTEILCPTPTPKQYQTHGLTSTETFNPTPTEILCPTPTPKQYQTHAPTSTETLNLTPTQNQTQAPKPTKAYDGKKDRHKASGAQKKLEKLLIQSCNKVCADCGTPDPKWVSLNCGVFICIVCSGIHRNLGVHISKVLSINLDDWTDEQVAAFLELGGNNAANRKYEACLPQDFKKPKPDSDVDERAEFIKRKYELLEFLNSNDQMICYYGHRRNASGSSHEKKHYDKQLTTRHRIGHAFRYSWARKDSETKSSKKSSMMAGMVEFIGLIKVNVVRGTNLAIRDVVSSDPYVILALGHQSVRTRVIKNNLNPVWNEKLMLSIPENMPPLKVLVYDKDTFSTDDFMGEGEIDIQPLVSAAKACETSSVNESTQLGNSVDGKDNTQVKDGVITFVDGNVRQEISLSLQNVERGVLEIELECVPLTQ